MAAVVAFTVAKGEDVTFPGTHQVSQKDTTPVDITTWSITVTVKNADGSVLFTKPCTITNGPKGQYTWPVTHTDTNVAAGSRTIDIFRTDSGFQRLMAIGTLVIGPDVLYGN